MPVNAPISSRQSLSSRMHTSRYVHPSLPFSISYTSYTSYRRTTSWDRCKQSTDLGIELQACSYISASLSLSHTWVPQHFHWRFVVQIATNSLQSIYMSPMSSSSANVDNPDLVLNHITLGSFFLRYSSPFHYALLNLLHFSHELPTPAALISAFFFRAILATRS